MGSLLALAGLLAVAGSLFAPPLEAPWPPGASLRGLTQLALLVALGLGAGLEVMAGGRRAGVRQDRVASLRSPALVCVATAAAVQAAGGPLSPWYPATYLALAVVSVRTPLRRALVLVAGLVAAEAVAAARCGCPERGAAVLLAHAALQVAFAVGPGALLRAEWRRRDGPLVGLDGRGGEDDRTPVGPARDDGAGSHPALPVDGALRRILGEVLTTQTPDGVAYVDLDERGERLEVRYVLPAGRPVDRGRSYATHEGVFRWLWERRRALHIPVVQSGFQGIPYYRPEVPVRSFLAVPVVDGGEVRGALCVDAERPHAFGHEQERLLHFAAQQIAEALGQARRLSATSRQAREYEALYKATRRLASTLALAELQGEVLDAARTLAPFDRGALLLTKGAWNGEERVVEVAAVTPAARRGRRAGARLVGRDVAVAGTRLGFALDRRLPLNVSTLRERREGPPLLPRGLGALEGESCLILPLGEGTEPIGALVLSAGRPRAFGRGEVRLLEILAAQAAAAIAHARLYWLTQEMANTDGLTGLANRRRFEERLAEEFARAGRAPAPFSLVLADLDHFKRINDAHGHPAGDAVLREVARRLALAARSSDTVGRLGGEEFGLLLVRADKSGALAVAERVRDEVRRTPVAVEGRDVRVTLSIGLASFPEDGGDPEALLASADLALYQAKRSGRDRVRAADPRAPARSEIALTARIP